VNKPLKRWPVPTLESCAVNRTQPKPRAQAWRSAIVMNNPTCHEWANAIFINNARVMTVPAFNLLWTDEIPF
jgi:hypothetical protein